MKKFIFATLCVLSMACALLFAACEEEIPVRTDEVYGICSYYCQSI